MNIQLNEGEKEQSSQWKVIKIKADINKIG